MEDKTSFLDRRYALKCAAHDKFKKKMRKIADKSAQNILAFQRSLEFVQGCLEVQNLLLVESLIVIELGKYLENLATLVDSTADVHCTGMISPGSWQFWDSEFLRLSLEVWQTIAKFCQTMKRQRFLSLTG